jgi:hypothetical protein
MIRYLSFNIEFHGLKIQTKEELEGFKNKVKESCEALHPNREYTTDVEIDLRESAGKLD